MEAKDKILNAAEEIFAMKGYGGARTAEIAKKAGVNKALLHYYYSSKDGLYHAVMDRILFELIQIAQDVLKKGLRGEALIEGLFDAFFDYAAKHQYFVRLTTVENAGSQARYLENMLRNFFKPLFERACDHMENEAKKGRLKKTDAKNFLITIYLSMLTFFSDSQFISAVTGVDVVSRKFIAERKAFMKGLIRKMLFK
jgi:AcrR family transcriptional regulator